MSTKKPMLLLFAGPNGSGKSTITSHFDTVGEYTNADDVVASTGISIVDAAKLVDERRYAAIEAKKDFTFGQFYLRNIRWIFSERQKMKVTS